MKSIRLALVLCLFLFLYISCNKTESPTQSSAFKKGEYSGTFSVTFKNYKNQNSSLSQSGDIAITFSDSSYSYSATVNNSSDPKADSVLADVGKFTNEGQKMSMNDQSWMYMDPRWHNSLYLFGTFEIQTTGKQLKISQENDFAIWNLFLFPK